MIIGYFIKIYSFFKDSLEKSSKRYKKCFLCRNYIGKNDILYFAMDNLYCSERCREYHMVYNFI